MSEYVYTGEVKPPTNALAERYASPEMLRIFSDEAKITYERQFWIDMMDTQAELGVNIPALEIDDYRGVVSDIDKESIRRREEVTRHDVNARLEEFNALAGHQHIGKGMTSRDLTENIEQLQISQGMELMSNRMVATLRRFADRAVEYSLLPMAGRSHNVAAETITLGKRFSNFGEELLTAYNHVDYIRSAYALRGIKGPVGTQQGMLELFDGDAGKVAELEQRMAAKLGFNAILGSVGQIYPRSLDFEFVSALLQSAAGPSSFATTLRLMAGLELATEGFMPGQVGSNAMPHKMNAILAERIRGLYRALLGSVVSSGAVAGDQWNEGDVSDSATRRVYIPDSLFAGEAVQLTSMKILDNFGAYPSIIGRELDRYLPFMLMPRALMIADKAGMERQDAHEKIKKHAVSVALAMREEGKVENNLFDLIDKDPEIKVTKTELLKAMDRPLELTGLASSQAQEFARKVEAITLSHPEAAAYTPPKGV